MKYRVRVVGMNLTSRDCGVGNLSVSRGRGSHVGKWDRFYLVPGIKTHRVEVG